jgi:hypothetical protein
VAGTQNTTLGCHTVTVPRVPFGAFDTAIRSWLAVRLVDADRPDVGAASPASGPVHGRDVTVVAEPFATTCTYAINLGPANPATTRGCKRA